MKKLSHAGVVAFALAVALAYTPALTQETTGTGAAPRSTAVRSAFRTMQPKSSDGRPLSTKSEAVRTALCKADCSPEKYNEKTGIGIHGIYRSYQQTDPHLMSVAGRKSYAECVQKCVAPLPTVYVQRVVFAAGMSWFGKSKQSCLECHSKGH